MKTAQLILENIKRNEVPKYDPYIGIGAPLKRKWLKIKDFFIPKQYVPVEMFKNKLINLVLEAGSIDGYLQEIANCSDEDIFSSEEKYQQQRKAVVTALIMVRCKHDFFYWAASFAKIKPKEGGDNIPFILNRPQRRTIEKLERMRLAGKPIRLIILKARQWGGSTAVQIYMAWIQLMHKQGWYSAIVAQDNSSSLRIKAMYAKLLENYPPEMLGLGDGKIEFGSYGGSMNDSIIKQGGKVVRDSVISIGSVLAPNSIRSGDIAMAHFSELGIWKETTEWTAAGIIRSVAGAILNRPLSMIVFESTANGTGNFFHSEWLRANKEEGDPDKSNMSTIFVSWFEIEIYQKPFDSDKDKIEFADWLIDHRDDDKPSTHPDAGRYYWKLWTMGASLENLNWYIETRRTFSSHSDMAAEFPSDDIEAFKHSGEKTFDIYKLEELRKTCYKPDFIGEVGSDFNQGAKALIDVRFIPDERGNLKVWAMPDKEEEVNDRYIVIVDPQKGKSKGADFSSIVVLDRYWLMFGGKVEVVAEWHGHIDKDLLAWKAAQLAQMYNEALLVIERNTYDNEKGKAMDEGEFIIDVISEHYENMHRYRPTAKIFDRETASIGFFTNKGTKPAIVNNYIAVVREQSYVERESKAINELLVYERKDDGNWGAMKGHHDDRVMSRAIGLYISASQMDFPSIKAPLRVQTKTIKARY